MTIEDIALQMTPGIGIKGAVHLLELFGDARSIFAATADELVAKADLRPDTAQQIVRRKGFPAAEKELAEAITAARRANLSWRQLGEAIGTTGEAARQRYAAS